MAYAINLEPHQAVVGHVVSVRGQMCEIIGVQSHRKPGGVVTVLTWKIPCATCGKPFHLTTGMTRERIRLRCDRCKYSGKPILPRRRGVARMTDDELRAMVANAGGVLAPLTVASADLELQKRRKREIRALRWDLEHGNGEARRAAERKLRKYRATPTEGIRIKRKPRKTAAPVASIFD